MNSKITVRPYRDADINAMTEIWNEVVEDGIAFPQLDKLTCKSGRKFFAEQTFCGVAENEEDSKITGLYILHPNNVGRCGHIANASFAVSASFRGLHTGEKLVTHCLRQAAAKGFKIMQFNAVVAGNIHARNLYERLGFKLVGTIPDGFLLKDGTYSDICIYYTRTDN